MCLGSWHLGSRGRRISTCLRLAWCKQHAWLIKIKAKPKTNKQTNVRFSIFHQQWGCPDGDSVITTGPHKPQQGAKCLLDHLGDFLFLFMDRTGHCSCIPSSCYSSLLQHSCFCVAEWFSSQRPITCKMSASLQKEMHMKCLLICTFSPLSP